MHDVGISKRPNAGYKGYDLGTDMDVWIKESRGEKAFVGEVWPYYSVFADMTKKETKDYWFKMLDFFHSNTEFVGIWLDMNDVSNMLCTGPCLVEQTADSPIKHKLPYMPTGRDIEGKSIALDSIHADGHNENDLHNYYCI